MAAKPRVLFRFGSRAEFDNLQQKDNNSLYFLIDTNELYRGNVPIGTSHYYYGTIEANETTAAEAITRILNNKIPVVNDLMTIRTKDNIDNFYIYTDGNEWKQLNTSVKSSSVLFDDGTTLDDKLANVQATININDKVLELDRNILSVKDYGKKYYHYVPESAAIGEEGQPEYVPAQAAHYELVTVDENHPWPENLTPKTKSDGSLGWYEPNPSTLEGLQDTVETLSGLITEIQNINNTQTQNIETLQSGLSTLGNLQEIVGTIGENGEPSTGLVLRVEQLEDTVTESGIQAVKVNNIVITPDGGVVNIPLFSDTAAGVVPAVNTIVGDINRDHTLLSANGWTDVIGPLSYNNQAYTTVTQYVDARVDENIIRWESINS